MEEPRSQPAEPLVELARRRPAEALHFLRAVLVLGSLVGPVLTVACGAFMQSSRWLACGYCGRPLGLWVVVHCALNLLQLPLRLTLLLRLEATGHEVVHSIGDLIKSRVWRSGTILSMISYMWCVIGVIWLLNSNFCAPCPELYWLMFVFMVLAILKPVLTLLAFQRLSQGEDPRPPPRGARQEVITQLPLVEFGRDFSEDGMSCAVCLSEFEVGEKLRVLPCTHKFHKMCIDKWLRRNKACPLCLHDSDKPPPRLRKVQQRMRQFGQLWKRKGA